MDNYIHYELYKEGYGKIILDRPEKRNAISLQMADQLLNALERAMRDDIKFLVITSSYDDVFCAGGDLKDFHSELDYEKAFSQLYVMKEVLFELVSFPVPTICLLNGNAFGGGCELATACDIRIAKATTSFGYIQTNLGILPGWGGGSLLYEKVHSSFAFQWITEGGIYDAPYLHERGWLHQITPDHKFDEDELLLPYVKNSLEQMKILKAQYKESLSSLSLSAIMNEEVRQCASLWNSPKHQQAISEFFNKTNQ